MNNHYDIIVIGGGPAGLASAISAKENGAHVLLIEREKHLGGILKQCIHDGFGISRFNERLSGPEYADRDIKKVHELGVDVLLKTFVLDIKKEDQFVVTITNNHGIAKYYSTKIILATGCRERTGRQIFIHGNRPSGIFSAGSAQQLVNIEGLMPAKNCVILGSGDIGLIMARRLTLEGAKVQGVYEIKSKPSGLKRNIVQCLDDFGIPLHLQKTVTRVFGESRLEAVEICNVDEKMNIIAGTEEVIPCDTLILSVGLIPENELAEKLGVKMCPNTKGPLVTNTFETSVPGVYSVGNSLSVNDLVDHVSENGFIAGKEADKSLQNKVINNNVTVSPGHGISYVVPQLINVNSDVGKVTFYIRTNDDFKDRKIVFKSGEDILFSRLIKWINQSEAIKLIIPLSNLKDNIEVEIV